MNLVDILSMTDNHAREYLEQIRWENKPVCPHCNGTIVTKLQGKSTRPGVYKCKTCRKQFTVTVGTVFERSHIPLVKWIAAFYLVCSAKKGISALQLSRDLGLSYKSAWYMGQRIRYALASDTDMLKGIVEVDETYVGGKARYGKRGRGAGKKTPLVAMIERNGRVKTKVVQRVSAIELKGAVRENVDKSSVIMTDEWRSYRGLDKEFQGHKVINHGQGQYVQGDVYTNTAESYFAIIKRSYRGIYHHISKRYLPRYCNEFNFRWNHRDKSEGEMLQEAIKMTKGKKLTYKNRLENI